MADNELLIRLGVEDSSATKKIKELNSELKNLDQEISNLDTSFGNYAKRQDTLNQKLELQKTKYQGLNEKLSVQNERLEKASTRLATAKQKYDELSKSADASKEEIEDASKEVERAQLNFNKMQREVELTSSELGKMGVELGKTKKAISDLNVEEVSKQFTTVGNAMTNVSRALTPLAVAISGVFGASINEFMGFEQEMKNVQAISGATGSELEKLTEKALEMAESTEFSADQVSQAMKYMAMAGWDTTQILSGIEGVMQLATASGEDLASVSDILTDSLTAFGMSAEDCITATDILAMTANASNTSISMLGSSFKSVAPIAGALGYSMGDVSLALGLMANSGIKAESAGTQLRTTLANLSKPTKEMSEAMQKYGISLTDSEGNMKSLYTVMSDLRESFKGLDETQKAELASTLAGKEGMSGLLAVVNSSDEDFNKLAEAIGNSNGACAEMADIMRSSTQNSVEMLKSKISTLMIEIGEKLAPTFIKVIDKISELVDWFSNLSDSTQQTIITLGGIIVVITPIIGALGSLCTGIGSVISFFGKLAPATAVAEGAIATLGTTTGVTSSVFAGFGTAIGALLNPVTAVVAVLGGLALACIPASESFNKWTAEMRNAMYESGELSASTYITNESIRVLSQGVDESTKQMINSFTELQIQATEKLTTLGYATGETARQTTTDLLGIYEEQKNLVLTSINTRSQEELGILAWYDDLMFQQTGNHFSNLLTSYSAYGDSQRKQTEVNYDALNVLMAQKELIGQEIVNENGEKIVYTKEMWLRQMTQLQQEVGDEGINILSGQQETEQLLLAKANAEKGKLNQDYLDSAIKTSETERDTSIQNANTMCDEKIRTILNMNEEVLQSNGVSKDELIKTAIDERNGLIEQANGMHDDFVEEIEKLGTDGKDEFDNGGEQWNNSLEDTGEDLIMTEQEYNKKMKDKMNTGMSDVADEISGSDVPGNMDTMMGETEGNFNDGIYRIESAWGQLSFPEKEARVRVVTEYTTVGSPTPYSSGISPRSISSYGLDASAYSLNDGIEYRDLSLTPETYGQENYSIRGISTTGIDLSPFATASRDVNNIMNKTLNYQTQVSSGSSKDLSTKLDKLLSLMSSFLNNQSSTSSTNFNIENLNVRNEQDIKRIARELEELRKMELMGRGE